VKKMTIPPNDLPPILTVQEAAAFLRIGRTVAYEAIRTGAIPSVRIGKLIRVPREALLTWIASQGQPDNPAPDAHNGGRW
jgi:excisionase family DNA binding protein